MNTELNERQQNKRFSSRIKLCLTNRKKSRLNSIENQIVLERTKLRKSPRIQRKNKTKFIREKLNNVTSGHQILNLYNIGISGEELRIYKLKEL